MLNLFALRQGRLVQQEGWTLDQDISWEPIWVDLDAPTPEEKQWVERQFGVSIPRDALEQDIEESARFYEENGDVHIRTDFLLSENDETTHTTRVAFIFHRQKANGPFMLISTHKADVPVLRLLRLRARSMVGLISDAREVWIKLFDVYVEYSADFLEGIHDELEKTSKDVLSGRLSDTAAGHVLATIAREEDLNGRVRKNLADARRAVSFVLRSRMLEADQNEDARQILRDIESLESESLFLFEKINFSMDAVVGFININQNKIIKIFSVVNVVLLPPTLVASVYGMNFRQMPELSWEFGYPLSLALMLLSALLPMWFFHRQGWLR